MSEIVSYFFNYLSISHTTALRSSVTFSSLRKCHICFVFCISQCTVYCTTTRTSL